MQEEFKANGQETGTTAPHSDTCEVTNAQEEPATVNARGRHAAPKHVDSVTFKKFFEETAAVVPEEIRHRAHHAAKATSAQDEREETAPQTDTAQQRPEKQKKGVIGWLHALVSFGDEEDEPFDAEGGEAVVPFVPQTKRRSANAQADDGLEIDSVVLPQVAATQELPEEATVAETAQVAPVPTEAAVEPDTQDVDDAVNAVVTVTQTDTAQEAAPKEEPEAEQTVMETQPEPTPEPIEELPAEPTAEEVSAAIAKQTAEEAAQVQLRMAKAREQQQLESLVKRLVQEGNLAQEAERAAQEEQAAREATEQAAREAAEQAAREEQARAEEAAKQAFETKLTACLSPEQEKEQLANQIVEEAENAPKHASVYDIPMHTGEIDLRGALQGAECAAQKEPVWEQTPEAVAVEEPTREDAVATEEPTVDDAVGETPAQPEPEESAPAVQDEPQFEGVQFEPAPAEETHATAQDETPFETVFETPVQPNDTQPEEQTKTFDVVPGLLHASYDAEDEAQVDAALDEDGGSAFQKLKKTPQWNAFRDAFNHRDDEADNEPAYLAAQGEDEDEDEATISLAQTMQQAAMRVKALFTRGAVQSNEDADVEVDEDAAAHEAMLDAEPCLPSDDDEVEAQHIQEDLAQMCMGALLRTVLTGIFALALVLLGLMAQGVLAPIAAINPAVAAVPFLFVVFLLLVLCVGVSYTVFIDGVLGLWRMPSPDSVAAIAVMAAMLQTLVYLMAGDAFDGSAVALFAPLAALVLFAENLGTFLMLRVVRDNFAFIQTGVATHCAYRLRDKTQLIALSKGLNIGEPSLLLSRPVAQMKGFLMQSFSARESDCFAQKIAYVLCVAGCVCGMIVALKGGGFLGAVSGFTAAVCIGAPLSLSLLAAIPSLLLQRNAQKANAVVPGWEGVATLGEIDTIYVDESELFPDGCATLRGIKTYESESPEREYRTVLYATSLLIAGCDTLRSLFLRMIDHKTEMLYPVKDLEVRYGQGFVGWCENNRVMLGTRAMMEQEGVALPTLDSENQFTHNGALQVMYLAVAGQIYATMRLSYEANAQVSDSLRRLRRENVRVIVRCSDPTLDAARIEELYHLQEGVVTVLTGKQAHALAGTTEFRQTAQGAMLHTGSFQSYAAGLKAAAGAADAEHTASLVQLFAVGFSVLLSLLLALSGSLLSFALIAAMLYQLAWSALTLVVTISKKYS